jgi:exonuclease SbcD
MKFFHLSDLHIGLKLFNKDLSEDQKFIFDQIVGYAKSENPDVVVIAGDIYDKAIPSAEAVTLFDDFISALAIAVPNATIMMISGNHDSAPRVNVFRNILKNRNIYMIGQPPQTKDEYIEKVTMVDSYGNVNFYLLPFVKPSMIKEITGVDEKGNNLTYDEAIHRLVERENIDESERNVLVSHQFYLPVGKNADDIDRMESEIVTVGNIDSVKADVLKPFDYAALGHIHKPMKVGSEFYRYSGTPLACSVSEAEQSKGVIVVEMNEKGSIKTEILPLNPLRKVRIITGPLSEILKMGCDDYVTIIITDKEDLDVIDMQDRIRHEFPNLLEIRRDVERKTDYNAEFNPEESLNPYELCNAFLSDLTDEEKELLRDVINDVNNA